MMRSILAIVLTVLFTAPSVGASLIGSPCFCAQACQLRGISIPVWTDPAGAQVSQASCPPANQTQIYQYGHLCSCYDPLDWYRLQNDLRPSQTGVETPPYKGP